MSLREGSGDQFVLDDAEMTGAIGDGVAGGAGDGCPLRVDELQTEADRILAELDSAEAVLECRVTARAELAEALAAPGDPADEPVQEVPDPAPAKVPVTGAIGPRFGEGVTVRALAPDYRRIV
ncbi:hypothetical protein [Streptomyces sp. NPDC002589]|uniref:hypothetical protein n=1 Tax=Streptomyces sp. NPDC002589 TaxID=3154420 RepID=UPI00331F0D48